MAGNSRTTEIVLTGRDAGASKVLNAVGATAAKNAKQAETAFGKSTSKIGGSLKGLGSQLATFGLPLSGALSAVGSKFDEAEQHGKGFGKTLSAIGGAEAAAATAGLLAFGGIAVRAALEGEKSQAKLETAIRNSGGTFKQYRGQIDDVARRMAKFGFENDDVNDSIARLIPATHSVSEAIKEQGLAADYAKFTGKSLGDATLDLVRIHAGQFRALKAVGVATQDLTKDQAGGMIAIQRLADVVRGQAAAAANTYQGKVAALKAELHNLTEEVGNKLLPVLSGGISGILSIGDAFGKANSATGGFVGVVSLLAASVPVGVFAVEKLGAAGGAIAGSFRAATAALTGADAAAVSSLAAFGLVGAAIAAVGAAFVLFNADNADVGNVWKKANDAAKQLADTGKLTASQLHDFNQQWFDSADAVTAYRSALLRGKPASEAWLEAQDKMADHGKRAESDLRDHTKLVDDYVASLSPLERATALVTDAQDKYNRDMLSGHATAQQLAEDQSKVKQASAAAGEAMAGAGTSAQDETKALQDLYSAEQATLGGSLSVEEANYRVSKAIGDVAEKQKAAAAAGGNNKDANDALTESNFALEHAVLQAGQAAADKAGNDEKLKLAQQGVADTGQVATASHNAQIFALAVLANTYPQLKPVIQGYIDTLNKTPEQKSTHVEVTGVETANAKLQSFLELQSKITSALSGNFNPLGLPRTAVGGVFSHAQARIIAEDGPEAVVPLTKPARARQILAQAGILSNKTGTRLGTAGLGDSGSGGGNAVTINLTVNSQSLDPKAASVAVQDAVRRALEQSVRRTGPLSAKTVAA